MKTFRRFTGILMALALFIVQESAAQYDVQVSVLYNAYKSGRYLDTGNVAHYSNLSGYLFGRQDGQFLGSGHSHQDVSRSILVFNLSDIPEDATIKSATLSFEPNSWASGTGNLKTEIRSVAVSLSGQTLENQWNGIGTGSLLFSNLKYQDHNNINVASQIGSALASRNWAIGLKTQDENENPSYADANISLTVVYTPKVTITLTTSFGGGTVLVDGSTVSHNGTVKVTQGTQHTFSFAAQTIGGVTYEPQGPNYWTNVSTGTNYTTNPAIITVTGADTYRANFSARITITVANSFGGGTLRVDGATVNSGASFTWDAGSSHTIEAIDQSFTDPGSSTSYWRVFSQWGTSSGLTISNPSTAQIQVTPNIGGQYTASFSRRFDINLTAAQGDVGAGGTYTVAGSTASTINTNFVEGSITPLTIQFNPPANTFFAAWSDGNTDNPRTLTPTDNLTLFARFKYAMKSSLSTATANSPQRRIAVFGATSHAVYPSAGCIWYTQNSGSGWSAEKPITLSGIAKNPSIAVTYPGGNPFVHVVWEEVTAQGYHYTHYRRSTDNGSTWGSDVQINSQTNYGYGSNDQCPVVSAYGAIPVVVWRFADGLAARPEPNDANTQNDYVYGTDSTSMTPSLDGQQETVRMAFQHLISGKIYYSEITPNLTSPYALTYSAPVCISGSTTGCANPTISTVTTSGTQVFTAYDAPSGSIRHLFFAERNSAGTWLAPAEISVDAYNSLSKPSIGVEANITILYENQKTINPTRTFIGKIYRATSGGSWTSTFDLGDGVNPQLAQFANGGAAMRSLWMTASGSAPYAITAKSYQAPMATELNTPGDNTTGIGFSPMLSWTVIQTADMYTLEVARNSAFTQNDTLIQCVTSYRQLSGLAVNTSYFWRVRAENNAGQSEWTDPYTFTTMSSNITLSSSVVNTHPVLTWTGAISGTPVSLMKRQCPYPSGTCGDPLTIYYGTATTFTDYSCTVVNKLLASANNYYWVVQGTAVSNSVSHYDATMMEDKAVVDIPKETALRSNYPNPFNPATEIAFDLAFPGYVSLVVYNTLGQEIVRLAEGYKDAGRFASSWNAANLPSGMYIARLTVSDKSGAAVYSAVKKLLLAK